jgi:hypothetical protein
MLWDDFARVGSPAGLRPLTRGPDARTRPVSRCARFRPWRRRAFCRRGGDHCGDGRVPRAGSRTSWSAMPPRSAPAETAMDDAARRRPAISLPLFLVHVKRTRCCREDPVAAVWSEVLAGAGRAHLFPRDPRDPAAPASAGPHRRPHIRQAVARPGEVRPVPRRCRGPLSKLELCFLGAMLDAPRMVWNKVFMNRIVFGPNA